MVGDYRERSSSDDEETTSSLYSAGKEYTATEWTDEKHSLYLKSIEASFVDQLYSSLGALGSGLTKENVPDIGTCRKPSEEQFKVLRDGFWQKMNVKQPEYRLKGRHGGSHEFLRSPWIKHFRSLPKPQSPVPDEDVSDPESQVVSSNGKKGIIIYSSASAAKGCSHSRDRDQISIGQAEVSDQNFVNEVSQGENGSSKKMKTVTSGSSSTDQVVPLRKTPAT